MILSREVGAQQVVEMAVMIGLNNAGWGWYEYDTWLINIAVVHWRDEGFLSIGLSSR